VVGWAELRRREPQLADDVRGLLYHFGVGLAFLGTVRPDGGPRLHPMCPLLTDDGLYAFIVPSPKQRDLLRDGRYAMHSFPLEDNEDATYLTGRATRVEDGERRLALSEQFVAERSAFAVPPPPDDHVLFEFSIEVVLLTRTTGHGDPTPRHAVWRAA
jgi:hypothetical protein